MAQSDGTDEASSANMIAKLIAYFEDPHSGDSHTLLECSDTVGPGSDPLNLSMNHNPPLDISSAIRSVTAMGTWNFGKMHALPKLFSVPARSEDDSHSTLLTDHDTREEGPEYTEEEEVPSVSFRSKYIHVFPLYQDYCLQEVKEDLQRLNTKTSLSELVSPQYLQGLQSRLSPQQSSPKQSSSSSPDRHLIRVVPCTLWQDLEEVKEAGLLGRLTPGQIRLQECMFELIGSEASYLRSLRVAVDHFCASKALKGTLSQMEHHILFSNIRHVKAASETFLMDLEMRLGESVFMSQLGDIVLEHSPAFRTHYVPYVTNMMYQEALVNRLLQHNRDFVSSLKQLEGEPVCQRQSLKSFLVLPFQRITRIKLILESILKLTEAESESVSYLEKAKEVIHEIVRECNEGVHKMKLIEELVVLEMQLDFGKLKAVPLVVSGRFLVHEGPLSRLTVESGYSTRTYLTRVHLHLFNDLLIISSKKDQHFLVEYHADFPTHVHVAQLKTEALGFPPESFLLRLSQTHTGRPTAMILVAHSRCTVPRLKGGVLSTFPILYWLPKYSIWDYGMPDLISGISVGIMHLPQGTFAVLSIMVGSVTERLAPDIDFLKTNGTNVTEEVDISARDSYRVQVAAATTVLAGLIQVVLGFVKFGFVGTYLSEPLVRAYTTAAAAHAVVAQLKYIFGVSPARFNGPLTLVYTLKDVCLLLPQTHLPTLAVSVVSVVFLIAAKELNSFLSPKLPVPIPVELITIMAATLISNYGHLNRNYTVPVVGEIPSGLSSPRVPDVSLFNEVIGDAFALALVAYAISISLGKTFALKHGYKVDSNQELVALGLSNTVGGFFQCYAVCASMSRSLIQESTGGKTQMAGIASAVIVLVTILKLGPLFQELPKAVLASIVFVNLKGMFKQYSDIITLWRSNKTDLVLWLVTWVSTLLFNLDLGLAASLMFALLTVIFRTQLPTYSLLGNVDGSELYVDMETHREVREIPGITIFRSSATVYFANAELYLEALKEKSGLDISKMIIYKRRQEAKEKRRQKRAERRAKRKAKRERRAEQAAVFSVEEEAKNWRDTSAEKDEQNRAGRENGTVFVKPTTPEGQCRWEYLKGCNPDSASLGWMSERMDGDTTTLGSSTEDTLSRDLERISLGSLGKWSWDIHSIILDLSTANFIDTVAIKTMKNIFQDFSEIDVDVYMAGCQASVVQQLELGHFFSERITKRHLFASVHDAVLFCLDHRGASSFPKYERFTDGDGSTKL
ncbi:solute carrier family 26 member 6-like isoform X2 [Dunckerocampus dactyliophorus]|uniref:solute carrier family 26 member 6-like isoform X2 n=1 Tax=Dunckerocampus dactyliophorus TaxID=161453 RepID=UPI0024054D46|nr:solute carrier family 26 member 6-like isoform X2 [Dunckerocampus dactyliophorus]